MASVFQSSSPSLVHHPLPNALFYFSGRSALFSLLQFGISRYGWERVFLPYYYCHNVESFLKELMVKVCYYEDGPNQTRGDNLRDVDDEKTAIVWVNYFGIRRNSFLSKSAVVIEDHTHDPFSTLAKESLADYCFASLRKTLPIPAGGILWSSQNAELPDPPKETDAANSLAFIKLSAMLLKKDYLQGENMHKDDFRYLYLDSEAGFENINTNAALPRFVKNLTTRIAVCDVRNAKKKNFLILSELISKKELLFIKEIDKELCPFGVVLLFENQGERDATRLHLINNKVYPAVLWPNQKNPMSKDFSERMLFLHCDCRYNTNDMKLIAELINNAHNA